MFLLDTGFFIFLISLFFIIIVFFEDLLDELVNVIFCLIVFLIDIIWLVLMLSICFFLGLNIFFLIVFLRGIFVLVIGSRIDLREILFWNVEVIRGI